MDSSTDRSAQVAHVLHGVRPAEPGEDACFDCGVLLCSFCVRDSDLCETCYEERNEEDAERRLYDYDDNEPTYTDWERVQDRWEKGTGK